MKRLFSKDQYLEELSFIILFLWTISPMVEYIFKNYHEVFYTIYYNLITYVIGVSGFILYAIYIFKLRKKDKLTIKKLIPEILILSLLIISIIATILSKNPHLSLFGESYRKEGLIIYIMYIGIILLASIIKDTKYIKYLFQSIIISCFVTAIVPMFRNDFTYVEFTSVFHNLNHYGYYLMINIMLSMFLFINSNKLVYKSIYMILYVFFIYLLIRNDTFGSYLAVFGSLIFLLIYAFIKKYQRSKIVLVATIFIVISVIVSCFGINIGERLNFESTRGSITNNIIYLVKDIISIANNDDEAIVKAGSERGILWKEAVNYTMDHPIIGGGMECLGDYYWEKLANYDVKYNDRPHNVILQASTFIGIPGAIIYLVLILYLLISSLKNISDPFYIAVCFTSIAYFISSMFGNSMYYTSPYFMILLGLLIGKKK